MDSCSTVLTVDLQEKANFTRLSRLLVDNGTEALRNTFDAIHPPSTLPGVLAYNKKILARLRFQYINNYQWNLLYPPSGNPDSKTFDLKLLFILIRNVCGFFAPKTGWNVMPVDTDKSISANIVRIKMCRKEYYGDATSTRIDNATFESLWENISQALVGLGIPQEDLDELKTSPLEHDEPLRKRARGNFKDKIKRKITVSRDFCNPVVNLIDIINMVAFTFYQNALPTLRRQENILVEQICKSIVHFVKKALNLQDV